MGWVHTSVESLRATDAGGSQAFLEPAERRQGGSASDPPAPSGPHGCRPEAPGIYLNKSGVLAGVRIISCYLPTRSPWLNAIEPKWIHGKRKVVEAERLLGAHELAERVCAAFGCPHYEHLFLAENVA